VVLLRLLVVVAVVTNPLAAVITAALLAALHQFERLRAWWLALFGVVTLAVMLLGLTYGPAYVLWARELGPVVFHAAITSGPVGVPGPAGALIADRWSAWLGAQVGVGAPLGFTVAGLLGMYVRRHGAAWRRHSNRPRVMKRDKAIARTRQMDPWGQTPPKARTFAAPRAGAAVAAREAPVATVADIKIRFGINLETGKPVDVPLAAFLKMCWIDGATGFGKTTDIVALVRGALEAPAAQPLRIPLVYINLKPDPEVTEAMRRIAARAGRRFRHVSIDGELGYNPIRHGTAGAVSTRIIEVEDAAIDGGFSEPFHKANGQELLGYATKVLDELVAGGRTYERGGRRLPWRRDLPHLHRIMRTKTLLGVSHHLSGDLQLDLAEYAEELNEIPRKSESAEGMRARIGKMLSSTIGPLLREQGEGLNFEDSILAGDVVVMDLDSMQDAVAATSLANLAIKDLQAVLGHLGSQSWNRTGDKITRMALIVVDEFSALGGDAVVDLLQRGRTNGAGVILATQDVGSVLETSQGLLTTILTNCNVQLVHVQSERAEDYAKSWGTAATLSETTQVFDDRTMLGTLTSKSGQGSLRETREFVIHPDTLRKLAPGEIILATRDPWQQRRVLVQRRMPEPLTADELQEAPLEPPSTSEAPQGPQAADEPTETPSTAATPPRRRRPAPVAMEAQPRDSAPVSTPVDADDADPWAGADDFELFDHDTEES